MAEEKITVKARIEAVVSCTPAHKVVRDPAGEKKVKEDLEKYLKAEGLDLKPDSKDFQSKYRTKLRAYAAYVNGEYMEKDGTPQLLVPKRVFENELKLSYKVDGKDYTQTVNFDTDTKCLEKEQDFYITVDRKHPLTVLKKSNKDYRDPEPPPQDGSCSMLFILVMIVVIAVMSYMKGAGG